MTSDFLPKIMHERAIWARKEFIKNPKKSQTDEDALVWCFCKEDNLWYSIDGNYSRKSPEEKRTYQEDWQKSVEVASKDYYNQVYYYSKIRQQVLDRDEYTCQRCGKISTSSFHIHHILKRKEGGSDCLDNLITVCPPCHKIVDTKEYNPSWQ